MAEWGCRDQIRRGGRRACRQSRMSADVVSLRDASVKILQTEGGFRSDLFRPVPTGSEHRPIPTLVGFNKVELGSDYDANRVGLR